MNQKKKIENYQQIAMGTGLRYDEVGGLFHGERDGFDFIVYAPDARYPYMMVLHTAAKSADGSTFDKQAVKPPAADLRSTQERHVETSVLKSFCGIEAMRSRSGWETANAAAI